MPPELGRDWPAAVNSARIGRAVARAGQRPNPQPDSMTSSAKLAQLLEKGVQHHQQNRLEEAERCYRKLLKRAPRNADALHLLGLIALERNDLQAARKLIGDALALAPGHPIVLNSMGETLRRSGDSAGAEPLLRQAIDGKPDYGDAWHNLGKLRAARMEIGAATEALQAAVRFSPNNARAWADLSDALRDGGRLADAIDAARHAGKLDPKLAQAHNALGLALKNSGRIDEALAVFGAYLDREADPDTASNYLLTSCYDVELEPAVLRNRHEALAARLFASQAATGSGSPVGSGRIGFVSGDLRNHALQYFLMPLLEGLGDLKVPCYAYHSCATEDAVTDTYRQRLEACRQVSHLDDQALAKRIREDRIEFLVDLSGHTGFNRLGVFARRPAPIQVNWIGYLATTGLDCFDAHVTDRVTVPPGHAAWFTEALAYVDHCQWCYQPPADAPQVDHRDPQSPVFTFGGLHAPVKLNRRVLQTWRTLLERCPHARLLLMANGIDELAASLARDLPPLDDGGARVAVRPTGSLQDFLAAHRDVDLMLDSFPYCGGTTSFHSLWMGVPIVTPGFEHPIGRGCTSILTALGRSDWIAGSIDDYVGIACELSRKGGELRAARASLREALRSSPITDHGLFARNFLSLLKSLRNGT